MTDREKAVVMAYTGTVMLTGDKLGIFYDYVAELMGTRLDTIAIAMLAENIKHRATPDFKRICKENEALRKRGRWEGWHGDKRCKDGLYRHFHYYECSECHMCNAIQSKYCPHCGARMDEKEDEEA